MDASLKARTLDVPSVLVGLGRFGSDVVRRLGDERKQELLLLQVGDPVDDDLGVLAFDDPSHGDEIAASVMAETRRILAHRRMIRVRDEASTDQHTYLRIFVVAQLGEAAVRDAAGPVLADIQHRLLSELGPIFEAFRTGAHRNGVVLPLLAMPHPAGHDDGEAVVATVKTLLSRIVAIAPQKRAIPKLYLIEDVAEFSILSPEELGQCMRNFLTLLIYGTRELGEEATKLIHSSQPEEPLATFACAVAELPRARLHAYGSNRIALEVLEAVIDAPRHDATLAQADALEEIEARSLDWDDTAEAVVREIIQREGGSSERDAPPRWWERGDVVRQRYGRDPGDASLTASYSAADAEPGTWVHGQMAEVKRIWQRLQKKRFDDVIDSDRARVDKWRARTLEKLKTRIDEELWGNPSPDALRRTEEVVEHYRREFRSVLDDAVRDRTAADPSDPPDFHAFRGAHARVLDAARCKPDPPRMLLWCLLALVAVVLLGYPVLNMLADALDVSPGRWFEPALRRYAWLTAFVLGTIGLGVFGWLRLWRAHQRLLDALGEMWSALDRTILGPVDSVLDYYSSRLRLSRHIARVEALLAVQGSLDADAEQLALIDKAAHRARSALVEAQRRLGVVVADDGDDLSELLAPGNESLLEPFIGAVGVRELLDVFPKEGKEGRISSVLQALGHYYGREDRWREEAPFTSLQRLAGAAAPLVRPIMEWDPFAGESRERDTVQRLASFVRRQFRSLKSALNYSGYEALDATRMTHAFAEERVAILPRAAAQQAKTALDHEGINLTVRNGAEPDRAYYIMAVGDIDPRAVASLNIGGPSSREPVS